jgi:hypothetical protein
LSRLLTFPELWTLRPVRQAKSPNLQYRATT